MEPFHTHRRRIMHQDTESGESLLSFLFFLFLKYFQQEEWDRLVLVLWTVGRDEGEPGSGFCSVSVSWCPPCELCQEDLLCPSVLVKLTLNHGQALQTVNLLYTSVIPTEVHTLSYIVYMKLLFSCLVNIWVCCCSAFHSGFCDSTDGFKTATSTAMLPCFWSF